MPRKRMEEWWEKWGPWVVMIGSQSASGAVSILVKKVIDGGMNHFVFITYRQLVGSFFLAPIAFFYERSRSPRLTPSILSLFFLTAFLGAAVPQYFHLLGLQNTTASYACAYYNMLPAFTLVLALLFGLEKLNIRISEGRIKLLGIILCLGGAILLTVYKGIPIFNKHHHHRQPTSTKTAPGEYSSFDNKGTERWILGSMALLAAQLLWPSWFLLLSRVGKRYPCQYSSTAIINLFCSFQSAVFCFAFERDLSLWVIRGKIQVFGILAAGIIVKGLGNVGQSWCVRKRGPVFTALFTPLVQIVAAILDVSLLHEQFFLGSLLGSITVVAGLYILLWGKTKEMTNSETKSAQEATEEMMKKEQDPHCQSVIDVIESDSKHTT